MVSMESNLACRACVCVHFDTGRFFDEYRFDRPIEKEEVAWTLEEARSRRSSLSYPTA